MRSAAEHKALLEPANETPKSCDPPGFGGFTGHWQKRSRTFFCLVSVISVVWLVYSLLGHASSYHLLGQNTSDVQVAFLGQRSLSSRLSNRGLINEGFLKWGYLQIIHFSGIFPYKPSILGYPHLWKPSNRWRKHERTIVLLCSLAVLVSSQKTSQPGNDRILVDPKLEFMKQQTDANRTCT